MVETKSFGSELKKYRERADLTLAELSRKTDISTATISKIETDSLVLPSMQNVVKLAETLEMPLYQAIMPYLGQIKQIEALEFLLETVLKKENNVLTQKVALRLLECPKANTFLSLDYLYQLAGNTEKVELRLVIYEVISQYSREHGIPVYLARSLFQKYMIRRDNLSQLDQTYIEGKELLHYMTYLHINERIEVYYKLGLHALHSSFYAECIQLNKQGIKEDRSQSEQKAVAVLAIVISYMELEDYILGNFYLEEYEKFDYPHVRKNVQHIRGRLYAKTGRFDKAIPALRECLTQQEHNDNLPIVNDLLEVYIQMRNEEEAHNIFSSESTFLPTNPNTPSKYDQLGLYFRIKGIYYLQQEVFDLGIDSLIQSISYYKNLGSLEEINRSLTILLEFHLTHKKNLSLDVLQKLVNVYNGTNIII
ncbi:helix-turn-helix domain-containing protein [Brevibacillus brevis]|uniref:helix-turn-helix domain-containing protein n=1 Tax=Brevibacillus brevis TaxID=1393 RepID=UPI0007D8C5E2|nr:helix-turn-helix domain-containing protein [Brevibacillus brevis]WGV60490.1 helix-turn-helix domain-containing protein [Brevibacillus brevis]